MGKIYKADFADQDKKTKTIPELFESIQLYRSEGRSIAAIHAAFCRSELWQKSLSSFAHEYYQYRRQQAQADPDNSPLAQPQPRGYFKSQSLVNPGASDSSLGSAENEPASVSKLSNEAPSNSSVSNSSSAPSVSKKSVKKEKPKPQPQSDPADKLRKIKLSSLSLEEEIAAHQAQARAIFDSQ